MTAVARIYRWELLKLLAQKRTYLGLGTAMVVPIIFVVVLVLQTGGPNDVPLGRYIRDTGLAVPFVVLFFMSIWGLPLITALIPETASLEELFLGLTGGESSDHDREEVVA